jgi:hypothetical protein
MRCNPNDEDAKFNYAFTKRLIQQQEQQQQQQNQDQNQDQNQNQNKDNQDKQNDQKQENRNQGDSSGGQEEDDMGQTPQPTGLSNEQERLLDAVQRQEDETQEKLGEERKAIYIPGKKNW